MDAGGTGEPGNRLTHLDEHGRASMVDVGGKPVVRRVATAEGWFVAAPSTLDLVVEGRTPKGEALGVARIAAIQGAKRCDELIPLCHTLGLDAVDVTFERTEPGRIRITVCVSTRARTGVEMEALTGVSCAALALYDMTKAVDRDLAIEGIRLLSKHKDAPG